MKKNSSSEPLSQFRPNLAQSILGWRGFKFVQMKGLALFQREIITKIAKKHWRNSKIFFSRTTEPISTKLGTKHPWVKGIQVCSNEGPRPFPRGDNYEIVKIHWWNFKIFLSRTTEPFSTKLVTKHPWVKGIQVCSNEWPRPFPRSDNCEKAKIHWQTFKNLLLQNHWANFNQTLHKASLDEGDSNLFKWRTLLFFKGR